MIDVKVLHVLEPLTPSPRRQARLWAREVFNEEPWSRLSIEPEGDRLRIPFPIEDYYGMPPFWDLERPVRAAIGGRWRLLLPDGGAGATYVLEDVVDRTDAAVEELETGWTS